MLSTEIGFATALLHAAGALGNIAQVHEDLPVIDGLLTQYARYFDNPEITTKEKNEVFTEVFSGKIQDLTLQFLILITSRNKLKKFAGIKRQYDKLAAAKLGTVSVRLSTPFEMGSATLKKMAEHLIEVGLIEKLRDNQRDTDLSSEDVVFEINIDKSLLGGFIAESQGRILDMSLRTKLMRLARE